MKNKSVSLAVIRPSKDLTAMPVEVAAEKDRPISPISLQFFQAELQTLERRINEIVAAHPAHLKPEVKRARRVELEPRRRIQTEDLTDMFD